MSSRKRPLSAVLSNDSYEEDALSIRAPSMSKCRHVDAHMTASPFSTMISSSMASLTLDYSNAFSRPSVDRRHDELAKSSFFPANRVWAISIKGMSPLAPSSASVGVSVADADTGFIYAALAYSMISLEAAARGTGGGIVEVVVRAAISAAHRNAASFFNAEGVDAKSLSARAIPSEGYVICDTQALRRFWIVVRESMGAGASTSFLLPQSDFRWGCGGAADSAAPSSGVAVPDPRAVAFSKTPTSSSGASCADAFPVVQDALLPEMPLVSDVQCLPKSVNIFRADGFLHLDSDPAFQLLAASPHVSNGLLESHREGANVRADAPGRSPLLRQISALQEFVFKR
jgi:hypothetical protein